jgi:putative isomerase
MPTESADLAAHLVLQWEGLALMAEMLHRPGEARRWRTRAALQLDALLSHGVRDGRFVSVLSGSHASQPTHSLLDRIPVVLGHRLPGEMADSLAAELSPGGPYLTRWGPATEPPDSPKYESDGYWRGPIWAPSTYQIVDGLRDAGREDLAREIARRFCDMCAREPGMYENYDAVTGKGLRCPGYSWTAAVFLLLAQWLGGKQDRGRGSRKHTRVKPR